MAWIQIHQQLKDHRKVLAAADELDIEPAHMLGLLISFWLWAIDNAPDGSLAGISDRMIARAAQWDKDPEEFVAALTSASLLDVTEDSVLEIENPSEGMRSEIEYAKQHQIPIRDASELYRNREVETLPIGDALIVLPSHVGNLNGVAAIESTTVRINGEMILDLAIELRRHPGHDITLEADKGADSEVDQ